MGRRLRMNIPEQEFFQQHQTEYLIPKNFSQKEAEGVGRALALRRRCMEINQAASSIYREIESGIEMLEQLKLEYQLNFNSLRE